MTRILRLLASAGAFFLICTASAWAELKLNDSFAVSGFVSGSYGLDKPSPGPASDRFGLDDALIAFQASSGPVAATLGLYHEPSAPKETKLHDVFLTYDTGRGVTFTMGKFQSVIAYESYYAVDNPTISFANNELLTIAPGYHSGLKVEYTQENWSVGGALLDSLYTHGNDAKGDGELRQNQGYEAFVAFRGVPKLEVSVSAGYEGGSPAAPESFLHDIWATYQLTPATLLAGNYSGKDGGTGDTGHAWLALVDHAVTDRASLALRLSGDHLEGGGSFTRWSVAPALKLTPALTLRAEYSHTNYRNNPVGHATAVGIQAFLKF